MAKKITELTELTSGMVSGSDIIPIVDVTASETKKITVSNLVHDAVGVGARVYNNTNLTITTSQDVLLTYNSEHFDYGDLHSTTSNSGRLTAPIAGIYLVSGNIEFAGNATGVRQQFFKVNGTEIGRTISNNLGSGQAVRMSLTVTWEFAANEYAEQYAYQSSGGDLNVSYGAYRSPEFMMQKIG